MACENANTAFLTLAEYGRGLHQADRCSHSLAPNSRTIVAVRPADWVHARRVRLIHRLPLQLARTRHTQEEEAHQCYVAVEEEDMRRRAE